MKFKKEVEDKVKLLGFKKVEDFICSYWDEFTASDKLLFELAGLKLSSQND